MPNLILIIIAAAAAAVLLLFLILYIRKINFRPTLNKYEQWRKINNELKPFGFAYRPGRDYVYSLKDSWQRGMGYTSLYDENALLFFMVLDCEPVTFEYKGKQWLIELWKGQYGIAAGGEIGIYHTKEQDFPSEAVSGTLYQAADDSEMLPMAFTLKKNGEAMFRRNDIHWWLTGFRPGTYAEPEELSMEVQITFPSWEMCGAFIGGLKRLGYKKGEYFVWNTTVSLLYQKPHSPQFRSSSPAGEALFLRLDKENCRLFNKVTEGLPDTMTKLEYVIDSVPELYYFLKKSLHSRGFYEITKLPGEAYEDQENNGREE